MHNLGILGFRVFRHARRSRQAQQQLSQKVTLSYSATAANSDITLLSTESTPKQRRRFKGLGLRVITPCNGESRWDGKENAK